MAKKKGKGKKKVRTRSHVLEDLSVNYVERYALLCNYAIERHWKDYGLDLVLITFDDEANIEEGLEIDSGFVHLQLKATDRLKLLHDGQTIRISVAAADILDWDARFHPVIFIVYDGLENKAYWLYVQNYLDENRSQIGSGDTVTLHIPIRNRVGKKAMRQFRKFLIETMNQ